MNDASPAQCVEVFAPARLHLGFLDLQGGLGRSYGSIGLAIILYVSFDMIWRGALEVWPHVSS